MNVRLKKTAMLLLAVLLALSLCGCGKSEAATAADEAIAAIGSVTLESGAAIEAAEAAVKALEEKDKGQLDNMQTLTDARAAYDALVLEKEAQEHAAAVEASADEIEELILAIGEVTIESNAAIQAARELYDGSDAEVQAAVECYAELEAAEQAYSDCRVAAVNELINAIGEVSVQSEDAIEAAEEAYAGLTDAEKAAVTGVATLTAARESYTTIAAEAKAAALKSMNSLFDVEEDRVSGITWYNPKSLPKYIDIRSYIIPYIGSQNNSTWIVTRYNYTADSWIFWETLTIMVDGKKYYKNIGYSNVVRDNDTEIWEYYDEVADDDDVAMLRAIADSSETIIRFEGDNYYDDLTVTNKDKETINDVLALYFALD